MCLQRMQEICREYAYFRSRDPPYRALRQWCNGRHRVGIITGEAAIGYPQASLVVPLSKMEIET